MTKFLLFLLLIILPFRLYHINLPLTNITNFRQAQTATVALNYYNNGIDLFKSELDIFGKGKERFLTLEFPLYEAIVALLYKTFFVHDMWGRIVSVIWGIIGGWYLYRLTYLLTKKLLLSFFTSFFFFFAPLNMFLQQDFLIESTIVGMLLSGFYYAVEWIHSKRLASYIPAIIFLSLGFMQKGMYGPFWQIPLVGYFLRVSSRPTESDSGRGGISLHPKFERYEIPRLPSVARNDKKIKFFILIIIPLLFLFFWQNHMNATNTANGHAYFTTTNPDHLVWNVGTLSDRIDWSLWQIRLKNLLDGVFLKPGLLLFFTGLLFSRKKRFARFFYVWLLAEAMYFFIFFRIQSHIYYQMVMIPPIAFFMASGLLFLKKLVLNRLVVSLLIVALLSFFISRSWANSQWDAHADLNWYNRLQEVGKAAPQDSWGIFVQPGHDWNSVYTYYPKLKLKVVSVEEVTENSIKQWQSEGYPYMILHDYEKYQDHLRYQKSDVSLEFLKQYKEILVLPDYKMYLLK